MATDKQRENREANLHPYRWKKGQSGNLKGRPKGKSMKEYSREYLESMTDDERQDFLEGQPKIDIWKMAEGNPTTVIGGKGGGNLVIEISSESAKRYDITPKPEDSSS